MRTGWIHEFQLWALAHYILWRDWALVSGYLAAFDMYSPPGTSLFWGWQDGVRPRIHLWLATAGRPEAAPSEKPNLQLQSWVFSLAKSRWGCGGISRLFFWSILPGQSPTYCPCRALSQRHWPRLEWCSMGERVVCECLSLQVIIWMCSKTSLCPKILTPGAPQYINRHLSDSSAKEM